MSQNNFGVIFNSAFVERIFEINSIILFMFFWFLPKFFCFLYTGQWERTKLDLKKFEHKYLNCSEASIKPISQEFLKRFYKPLYIPLIGLVGSLLLIRSKESQGYSRFKLFLFLITFLIIVLSEILLRYSSESLVGLLFFIIFPLLAFSLIYIFLLTLFDRKA